MYINILDCSHGHGVAILPCKLFMSYQAIKTVVILNISDGKFLGKNYSVDS